MNYAVYYKRNSNGVRKVARIVKRAPFFSQGNFDSHLALALRSGIVVDL